jgi:hypothetical protein
MWPDLNNGKGPRQDFGLSSHLLLDLRDERLDLLGDIFTDEEVFQVGINAVSVEMHYLQSSNVNPTSTENMGLQCKFTQMLSLDFGGRLDLRDTEPFTFAFQNIDCDELSINCEGSLIDDLNAFI